MALALVVVACGGAAASTQTIKPSASPATSGPREIAIEMVDIAFGTTSIDVAAGQTIHFVFHNTGAIRHEAVIGDKQRQEDHEMEMMASMAPDSSQMEMEAGEISLEPGTSGSIDYTFDTAGTFFIGCHEPGHYAAGMVVTVNVQ